MCHMGKLVSFLLFYVTYAMFGVTGSLFLFALFSFAGVENGLNSTNQNDCLSTQLDNKNCKKKNFLNGIHNRSPPLHQLKKSQLSSIVKFFETDLIALMFVGTNALNMFPPMVNTYSAFVERAQIDE